jgi:hypothetical protein
MLRGMPMHPVLRDIDPDEIRAQSTADGHVVVVTDKVLRVGSEDRVVLDVAIDNLRRIQFDIERDRPATLVIVPLLARDEPQVVVVQPHEYASVAQALAFVGQQMALRTGGKI